MRVFVTISLVLLLTFSTQQLRSQVEFIADPNTSLENGSSDPVCFTQYGDDIYFGAYDFNGGGMWKTDGTEAGTVIVSRKVRPKDAIVFNNNILILGFDNMLYFGLWISDGTDEGTKLLSEFQGSSYPEFVKVNNKVFFKVYTESGEKLVVTDGTKSGTKIVQDLNSQCTLPRYLSPFGELLIYTAKSDTHEYEVWRSDGTTEGTFMISTNLDYPYGYVQKMDRVYFISANDTCEAVFSTDGSVDGTKLEVQLPPNTEVIKSYEYSLLEIAQFNDTLYFPLKNTVNHLYDIWKYGGDSIELVHKFPDYPKEYLARLYTTQDGIIASVAFPYSFQPSRIDLYTIDDAGMNKYYTIAEASPGWDILHSEVVGPDVYFSYARQLWKTDGTNEGTKRVFDQYLNIFQLYPIYYKPFFIADNLIYYSSNQDSIFNEPWVYNLQNDSNSLLKDINGSLGSSNISIKYIDNNKLYFSAFSKEEGNELWISTTDNGSAQILKDIFPGVESSNPRGFVFYHDKLYFSAKDSSRLTICDVDAKWNLWKTDGTYDGTEKVSDVTVGEELIELNDKLYFAGARQEMYTIDLELWESDGTDEGTKLLNDLNTIIPTCSHSSPNSFKKSGNKIFFAARTAEFGLELMMSDGNSENTSIVKNIRESYANSLGSSNSTNNINILNGKVLFTPDDGIHGKELWISDGTEEGTQILMDIAPGIARTDFYRFFILNNNCFFWAKDADIGMGLWITDGTSDGTRLLKDVNTLPYNGQLDAPLGSFNDVLIFSTNDGIHGTELWRTDGTVEGTLMIKDLNPGENHSYPSNIIIYNGLFYFISTDEFNNSILWESDGTEDGTQVFSSWDGNNLKDCGNLVLLQDYIYFNAFHEDYGGALFRINLDLNSSTPTNEIHHLVYPNPTTSILNIRPKAKLSSKYSILIKDLTGKTIMSKIIDSQSMVEMKLDVSNIAVGIYLVVIQGDDEISTYKFIKNK